MYNNEREGGSRRDTIFLMRTILIVEEFVLPLDEKNYLKVLNILYWIFV